MAKEKSKDTPQLRLKALAPEKKAQLLDPAEKEFASKGFISASLNNILREAGMSKGQAYYYVENKADLYSAVCERAFHRLFKKIETSEFSPQTPEEFWWDIQNFCERLTVALNGDETLSALGRSVYDSKQAEEALSEPLSRLQIQFNQWVELGQLIGAIRKDIPSDLLQAILFGVFKEIDRWFATNLSKLENSEAIRLNALSLELLRTLAEPKQASN